MTPLLVALGGALGAPTRLLVERAVTRRASPGSGTVVVNLFGSLLLGLLVGALEIRGDHPSILDFAGVGFLGAFTTFSTFAVESVRLRGRARVAYLGTTLVGCLIAAGIGVALGRAAA